MRSRLPEITRRMLIAANYIIETNPKIPDMKTFAEAIGADKVRASRWKSGNGNVTVDNIYYANKVFGISLDFIFKSKGGILEK